MLPEGAPKLGLNSHVDPRKKARRHSKLKKQDRGDSLKEPSYS